MKRIYHVLLVAAALVMFFNSCKKNNTTTPPASPTSLASRLHIVDSTQWILKSVTHVINGDIYKFQFTPNTPNIDVKVGDILLGITGDGYIRKVKSVTVNNDLELLTDPAPMEAVFKGGSFSFDVDMSGITAAPTGFSDSLSNIVLYDNSSASIKVLGCRLDMNPQWHFNFAFDTNAINTFSVTTSGATYSSNTTYKYSVPLNSGIVPNVSKLAKTYHKKSINWVQVSGVSVPVVVSFDVDLTLSNDGYRGTVDTIQGTVVTTDVINAGASYANNVWTGTYSSTPVSSYYLKENNAAQISNWLIFSLTPKISISLYGVVGPTFSFTNRNYYKGTYTSTSAWDYLSYMYMNPVEGASGTGLGKNVPVFTQTWVSDSSKFQTPDKMVLVTGNNQSGAINQPLANPVQVKVIDANGAPQPNVSVSFAVMSGGGYISPPIVFTDANGIASAVWKLGATVGTQTAQATAVYGNSQHILGAPVAFTATGQ
jgi:hypothetical protein